MNSHLEQTAEEHRAEMIDMASTGVLFFAAAICGIAGAVVILYLIGAFLHWLIAVALVVLLSYLASLSSRQYDERQAQPERIERRATFQAALELRTALEQLLEVVEESDELNRPDSYARYAINDAQDALQKARGDAGRLEVGG